MSETNFTQCPVCNKTNKCQSAKIDTCWCQSEIFPEDYKHLPEIQALDTRCICMDCLNYIKQNGALPIIFDNELGHGKRDD